MSSCINKISEAEEQYSYVDYLFRGLMGDIRKDIDGAKDTYRNGDYVLCLYKATLTKAQILQQAGIAILSQANAAPQAALTLLRQ